MSSGKSFIAASKAYAFWQTQDALLPDVVREKRIILSLKILMRFATLSTSYLPRRAGFKPSSRRKPTNHKVLCGRCADRSARLWPRYHIKQHREVVKQAARQHEGMPDGMVIRQPLPGVEHHAEAVAQAAGQQQP